MGKTLGSVGNFMTQGQGEIPGTGQTTADLKQIGYTKQDLGVLPKPQLSTGQRMAKGVTAGLAQATVPRTGRYATNLADQVPGGYSALSDPYMSGATADAVNRLKPDLSPENYVPLVKSPYEDTRFGPARRWRSNRGFYGQ